MRADTARSNPFCKEASPPASKPPFSLEICASCRHAHTVNRHADTVNRHAHTVNRHADTVNRHAHTVNRHKSAVKLG